MQEMGEERNSWSVLVGGHTTQFRTPKDVRAAMLGRRCNEIDRCRSKKRFQETHPERELRALKKLDATTNG